MPFLYLLQDDRRATQDSLPQRTLIELDPAGPRYSHHSLSSFIFSPAIHTPFRSLISCFSPVSTQNRYLVVFNPIEQERLCTVTVLVNTVKVRVLTEDGQTLPVQLSAQWSSATQMSAEVFEVRDSRRCFALQAAFKPQLNVGRF